MVFKKNSLNVAYAATYNNAPRILTKKQIKILQEKIGIVFRNPLLLERAFIHRSYLNEHKDIGDQYHNELLEFLGDAVLEIIVTDRLFRSFPHDSEGTLTSYRASLVNTIRLADRASEFGFYEFIAMSKGQRQEENRRADRRILANTFEALVGAIYLDRGLGAAELFLDEYFLQDLFEVIIPSTIKDPKSMFQECAQEQLSITPHYLVIDESGLDHDKHFVVQVMAGNTCFGEGRGVTKKEAEQDAAKSALEKIQHRLNE